MRVIVTISITGTALCRFVTIEAIASHRAAVRHVVESHHTCNAWVFDPALRGQDTGSSDLDLLIDPTPTKTVGARDKRCHNVRKVTQRETK